MNWYISVLQKYAVFDGRARRQEYWMFALFSTIVSIVLSIIGAIVIKDAPSALSGIYSLAVLLPSLGVSVRRMHDTGRSGWWLLLAFIPIVGAIILFVFTVQDSQPGENQYGPNPKLAFA